MFASDVLSRGYDDSKIDWIVQFDYPQVCKQEFLIYMY